ncbi:MAG: murein transglycosylase A [Erythrobacter sp.]
MAYRFPHFARLSAIAAGALVLAGCGSLIPDGENTSAGQTPPVTGAESALLAGVKRGPSISSLGMRDGDAATALASFVESCPKLLSRTDRSGLTTNSEWQTSCGAASGWPASRAEGFFKEHFQTVIVGSGEAFATGYFEPEIRGCRTAQSGCNTPIYSMPDDLKRQWPSTTPVGERTGRAPLGRTNDMGEFVPYYERSEIEAGALSGRGLEIAYAADPVELFFLQIQGSGRVRTPQGEIIRIGYAGQNGREYVGIGGVMRKQGLLGEGPGKYAGSMQGIMQYIRENPADGKALMQLNKSWIFFRVLTGDGPLGSIGVPVRRESSVAVDPRFVPYGAPVWLGNMDNARANGMWIAQDTGGAIKGANRFDTFWGAGQDARTIAGGMSARGEALLLLPKVSAERLNAR